MTLHSCFVLKLSWVLLIAADWYCCETLCERSFTVILFRASLFPANESDVFLCPDSKSSTNWPLSWSVGLLKRRARERRSVCTKWFGPIHSRHTSQRRWSRRTIPNKHGCRQDCGCWLEQNDVTLSGLCLRGCPFTIRYDTTSLYRRPACSHVRWGRSASQSTASNASAVLIGRTKSREYLTQEAFEKYWAHSSMRAAARRIAIHQMSLLSRRTPPAHRCPQQRRRRRRQRQRVTEGTAMAP